MRLIERGEKSGIRLRLLGGVAIRLLCKDIITEHPRLDRLCGDIDFVGLSENTKIIEEVLHEEGFKPHKEFNFLNVASRMLFSRNDMRLDVILDEFRMNHHWPIRERLLPDTATLPIEDLMLTKLQIVQLNEKDVTDLLALGLKSNTAPFDLPYIEDLCLSSWGFTYTVTNNCKKILDINGDFANNCFNAARNTYIHWVEKLQIANKSLVWRFRSLIGTKLRWYDKVEEEPLIDKAFS